ncbi:MAG: trigger factor [Verrucomicrobiota bacterium]|nr:trigger factor [Verrucomicrobiota bacterium]
MNVVVETLPHCLATLRVEVEPQKVSEAWEAVTNDFGKRAKLPGYRPGKVPRAIIEKKFSKEIRDEVEKRLLSESAREAIKQQNLRVLQLTSVDDVELGEDKRMSFTATVVTHPSFELPEYKGIPVPRQATEVTEEEIDQSLNNLRDQAAEFTDIPERGAQMEDYLVVDYRGTIDGRPVEEAFPKAGKPLTGNDDFWIKMSPEAFFPGFCNQLVGARAGDVREFEIEVPAEFPVEGMPGRRIRYVVTVKALKQKVLPELNDAFADKIMKGKTLTELRAIAREEISLQKKTEADTVKRNEVMKHLLAHVECELPQNLVRQETRRILNDIVRENQARGVAEDVLKQNERELVGAAAINARDRVKGTFVLLRIAEKEGIKINREEFLGRVAALAQRYEMTFEKMLKELEKRGGLDQINEEILTGKVLDFLVANASVSPAS